jgi:hypothetical protein
MQQKQPSSSGKKSEKKFITPESIEEVLTEQQSVEEVSESVEVQIISVVSVSSPTVLDLTSPTNLQCLPTGQKESLLATEEEPRKNSGATASEAAAAALPTPSSASTGPPALPPAQQEEGGAQEASEPVGKSSCGLNLEDSPKVTPKNSEADPQQDYHFV